MYIYLFASLLFLAFVVVLIIAHYKNIDLLPTETKSLSLILLTIGIFMSIGSGAIFATLFTSYKHYEAIDRYFGPCGGHLMTVTDELYQYEVEACGKRFIVAVGWGKIQKVIEL